MCQLLKVSLALYYRKKPDRTECERWDTALREAIEKIILTLTGYGYRRVTRQLKREGWAVNHKRVLRIMREESLLCKIKKARRSTTDSAHGKAVYPNLIKDLKVGSLNRVWVADITYIKLPSGFCYLAVILDSHSRKVVGWHLSRRLDARLCLTALDKALAARKPEDGWIHHSDQGVQYASKEYVERLKEHGARISMSRKGNPQENAKAESFFRTLKSEEVYLQQYGNMIEAMESVKSYIEGHYNSIRMHSALGYLSPAEYEERLFANPTG